MALAKSGFHASLKQILLFAATLNLICVCSASAGIWSSTEIEGRVIDAETGIPVKDVVVVANWQLTGELEGYQFGQLALLEAVTDGDGRFIIPAWGPRRSAGSLVLRGTQPIVRVFRLGYLPIIANNLPPEGKQYIPRANTHIHPRLNGQTLNLALYHGSPQEYATLLEPLRRSLEFAFWGRNCEWKAIPRAILEFEKIRHGLEVAEVASDLPQLQNLGYQNKCGNAVEFFKEKMK
jgi:hypothetical protein